VAPDRAAPHKASRRSRSIRPPSLAYTAATPWLSPCPWWARESGGADASWRVVKRSCGRRGTTPPKLASPSTCKCVASVAYAQGSRRERDHHGDVNRGVFLRACPDLFLPQRRARRSPPGECGSDAAQSGSSRGKLPAVTLACRGLLWIMGALPRQRCSSTCLPSKGLPHPEGGSCPDRLFGRCYQD
jgi:hypothetical protein